MVVRSHTSVRRSVAAGHMGGGGGGERLRRCGGLGVRIVGEVLGWCQVGARVRVGVV